MTLAMVISRSTRCVGRRHLALWGKERRERFLFNVDAPNILSVDTSATSLATASDEKGETMALVVAADIGVETPYLGWEEFVLGNGVPEPYDPSWHPLGFDVCDGSLVSGLANCGMEPTQREIAAARWGRAVNRFHLFENIDAAEAFRQFVDSQVQEHAPFFVVRLFGAEVEGLANPARLGS